MHQKVMRTPRSLDLEITSKCNANCRYCYYLNNPNVSYTDLPTETWLAFFSECARHQIMSVTLQGGEPLLRDDFLQLVDGIVANKMRFSLLTNGSLMTPGIAESLKKTKRCDMVQVSLDGSSSVVHESLRGPGTFLPALEAIKILQDNNLPVTVRVTVHPGNIENLDDLAHLLLEDLRLPSFSTNATSVLGSSTKYDDEVLLKPLDRLRAMRVLAKLDLLYPERIQANAGPLADWHMFNAMETARQKGEPIHGRGKLVGCGCIFNSLTVRSDGAIIPCAMLPQNVLGHILKDPLDGVWQSSKQLDAMRERVDIPLEIFEECSGCVWRESCTGNCPGTALTGTGDINRPCPQTCLKRFQKELLAEGTSLWPR